MSTNTNTAPSSPSDGYLCLLWPDWCKTIRIVLECVPCYGNVLERQWWGSRGVLGRLLLGNTGITADISVLEMTRKLYWDSSLHHQQMWDLYQHVSHNLRQQLSVFERRARHCRWRGDVGGERLDSIVMLFCSHLHFIGDMSRLGWWRSTMKNKLQS